MGNDKGRKRVSVEYRVPFFEEAVSERWFVGYLKKNPDRGLLPIGRQLIVYDGPERLDLLAIDRDAVPWVFEFKRDVARPTAVGQLLTYGSFVATRSREELCALVESPRNKLTGPRKSGSNSLPAKFRKRFGCELPQVLQHRVKLVLAAPAFSHSCQRALQFMDQGGTLSVGMMHLRQVIDADQDHQVELRWLRMPGITDAFPMAAAGQLPKRHFVLCHDFSSEEKRMNWQDALDAGLIQLPLEWGDDAARMMVGDGIFVYVHGVPNNYENDLISGLIGYGIVREPARQVLSLRERSLMSEWSTTTLNANHGDWLLSVDWVATRTQSQIPVPVNLDLVVYDGIIPLTDAEQILHFQKELNAAPIDFDDPVLSDDDWAELAQSATAPPIAVQANKKIARRVKA